VTRIDRLASRRAERGSSEKLDSFRTDSRDTGLHDLSGEAVDIEMQARAGAEAAFATGTTTGGERLTASGRSSARSGTPTPRESDATSNLTAQFTLTEPADYMMSGTLTGTGPAGQCCSSAVATLRDEDGNKLVNEIAKIGDSPTTIGAGGTLPPGEYTLSIEANKDGGHVIELANKDGGHAIELGGHDGGHAVELANKDGGHAIELANKDGGHAIELGGKDGGHAIELVAK